MSDISTSPVYSAALSYISRGWAIIPVHGLANHSGDRCTCGMYPCQGPISNDRAGKHPARMKWQQGAHLSSADAYILWIEEHPEWNIGIRTGEPSGIFVLDIDPKSDGLSELAKLVDEFGELPHTYTVRTGSGGRHYYFKMPDFPVRSNVKRIAHGIDIRGTGGMVVAAPSVSGIGPYEVVVDAEVADAPAWLLDKLLPTTPGDSLAIPSVVEDLPAYADLVPYDQERSAAYAVEALAGEAAAYKNAPPGTGNERLYNAACNMIEIAQSPWNLYTIQDAYDMLNRAREERNATRDTGGQSVEEFNRTFDSARTHVAGQGRALPEDRDAGVMFDPGDLVPEDKIRVDFSSNGNHRLDALESRFFTRSQAETIPPPTPLISDVLDLASMTVLSGQYGTFKSFVAVDWACSIATGYPWMGHETPSAQPVIYVAAEGMSGIKKRILAWERANGVKVSDDKLFIVGMALNIGENQEVVWLMNKAANVGAKLIVFDTLHQCAPSLDENNNSDMGRITRIANLVREHVNGCSTLFVHHAGHGGTRSRGASSIEADADTVWITQLTGDESRDAKKPRRIEHRKSKDSDLLEPFFIGLEIDNESESGSLVMLDASGNKIDHRSPFAQPSVVLDEIRERIARETNTNAQLLLNVFLDVYRGDVDGVTKTEIQQVAFERYKSRPGWKTNPREMFARAWRRLKDNGVIEEGVAGRWMVVPVSDRQAEAITWQEVKGDKPDV